MSTVPTAKVDSPAYLAQLVEEQEKIFVDRQPRSKELGEQAIKSLAGGATSSWMIARPQTVWLSHGSGSKIYDVDGNEYVDLHGGYGVGLIGHDHPAFVRAVSEQVTRGTHFAQPTEAAIVVAEELSRRFDQPLWRFTNSGTEATLDAFHLMRAATERDIVIKIEGCYHGHHDSAMVSVLNEGDEIGPRERPLSPPAGAGLPAAITELTRIAHFNDLESVERILQEYPGQVAGMILEPIMMNAGIIAPEDTPDIVCLAKAMGGGVPCGAIGGTHEVMDLIAEGEYEQVGTFNGNPLTMATTKTVLTEILDDEAYRRIDNLREHMVTGVEEAIAENDLEAYPIAFGAKGCVTFSPERTRDFRDFLAANDDHSHLHWLFQHNGGVFMPPWGKAEQWTLSVQHTTEDAQRFVDNFRTFARAVAG